MRKGVAKFRLIQAQLDELGIITSVLKTGVKEYQVIVNGEITKLYKKRDNANIYLIKLIKKNAVKPIGIYGCYCHPFKNWPEHDRFFTQKLAAGTKIKTRCSGTTGELVKKLQGGFWEIKTMDKTIQEHTQNLIVI
jgi:hypothetical protein